VLSTIKQIKNISGL